MSVIFTVKVDKLSDEKQQDGIQADLFSLHPLSRIPADLWLSMHLVPQRLTVWMNLQAQEKKKKHYFSKQCLQNLPQLSNLVLYALWC